MFRRNDSKLLDFLEKSYQRQFSHLLVVGDFNCRDICSLSNTADAKESSIQAKLLDQINMLGLFQHVKENTRFRHGQQPSLLDLVITNEQNMVEHIKINSPLGKSEHSTISFNFKYSSAKIKEKLVPRYYKGNYDGMREYLREINWEVVLETGNIQDSWQQFENILLEATNNFVPKSVIRPNKNSE